MKKNTLCPKFLYALLGLFIMIGCNNQEEQKQEVAVVSAYEIKSIDTLLETDYVAEIRAFQNVEIRSRINGYLEEILVDEGKPVQKGQVLFKINDEEYKLGVAKARAKLKASQAQLKELKLELDRSKLLTDNNVTTKSDYELALAKFEAAKSQVEEAEAELNEANLRLSYATVRAPFNGFTDRLLNKKGSLIDEGTLLTTITDIQNMYVYFHLSEKEYLRDLKDLAEGNSFQNQIVSLILADGTTYSEKGQLQTMETTFEQSTGSISVRSIFPNKQKILKHGSSGKIRLQHAAEDVMLIPQKAIVELQDKYYVYVIQEDSTVKIQAIEPVERITGKYVLEEGLQPGQKIVLEGIQRVRDGATVSIKNS